MQYLPYIGLVLLAASLYFSLVTNSLRRYKMLRLEQRFLQLGRPQDLDRFMKHEDALLLAASVWRIMVNVAFVLLLVLYAQSLKSAFDVALAGFVAAVLLCILGVAVPMAWAKYNAEWVIVHTLRAQLAIRRLSLPALAFLDLFDELVRRLSGAADRRRRGTDLESELLSIVKEGELEGAIEENEKEMIESIIEFKDADVSQAMAPRTEMVCVPHDMPLAAARDFVVAKGHSRIPVFQNNLDTIVGVLYAKDLLAATGQPGFETKRVSDVMRKAQFIPETKKLTDLLHDFQHAGVHVAIVLDEYGGTAGLVTIEDVIEEIVGEFPAEHGRGPQRGLQRLSAATAEVEARARISDVNQALSIDLPEADDYETVGGFVVARLGYIPKAGETLQQRGLTITVLSADERRVHKIRLDGLDKLSRPAS